MQSEPTEIAQVNRVTLDITSRAARHDRWE